MPGRLETVIQNRPLKANKGTFPPEGLAPLRESTLELPIDELRRRYKEDGYVFVRSLLPPEVVSRVRSPFFPFHCELRWRPRHLIDHILTRREKHTLNPFVHWACLILITRLAKPYSPARIPRNFNHSEPTYHPMTPSRKCSTSPTAYQSILR